MTSLRDSSDEELLGMINRRPVSYATREEIDTEIQRRFQERNLKQIGYLVGEISKLKDVADTNAKSSGHLSVVAIIVASISLIVQVLLSTHQTVRCRTIFESNTELTRYEDCQRIFDLGIFGERAYNISNFTSPSK